MVSVDLSVFVLKQLLIETSDSGNWGPVHVRLFKILLLTLTATSLHMSLYLKAYTPCADPDEQISTETHVKCLTSKFLPLSKQWLNTQSFHLLHPTHDYGLLTVVA